MADLMNYSIVARPNVTATVAVIRIQGQLVDSANQASVIMDFSGANVIDFALKVPGFTAQDHRDLVDVVANWLILRKAGLG